VFTPKETIEFENKVRRGWAQETVEHGPVGVEVTIGAGWFEVEVYELLEPSRSKNTRGDLDNYIKSILDGLNGAAFTDDRQVHYVNAVFAK
jgi:Holliday junction resolvase RusA-like endonuclease